MAETEAKKPRAKRTAQSKDQNQEPLSTFFQKINAIEKADWGTRARIYVYRVEPIIDRLRSGEKKYIMAYDLPVDENRILADHGSGRYKLVLNFRKPGAEQGNEIDSCYIEMLNPEFPPKIPSGEWVEDARNKKWAWAKPLQQQTASPNDPVPMLRVFNEIRESVRDENKSADPLDTLIKAKTIFAPPATENTVLTTIVSLMNQQSDSNSKLVLAVMNGAQTEARELREEVRRMREQPLAEKKSGFDMFKEGLGMFKDLAPTIKEIFPGLKEAAANGLGRSRMNGWQEFFQPIVTDVLNSPVTNALGQLILMKAAQAQGMNGTAQPAATVTNGAPRVTAAHGPMNLVSFLDEIWPKMLRYLQAGWPGDEFAGWVFDGYGCPYNGFDWLGQAKMAGAIQLMQAFKSSPYWPQIAVLPNAEVTFGNFITSFIGFNPAAEAADAEEEEDDDDEVVDLRAEHA